MSKISFFTKPQKKYYSYASDGHIYKISSSKPTVIAQDGGYFYCYFQCTPYYKDTEGKTHLLYEYVKNTDKYVGLTNVSYFTSLDNYGQKKSLYYYDNDGNLVEFTDNKYYNKNGKNEYSLPNDALELPHVAYPIKQYEIPTEEPTEVPTEEPTEAPPLFTLFAAASVVQPSEEETAEPKETDSTSTEPYTESPAAEEETESPTEIGSISDDGNTDTSSNDKKTEEINTDITDTTNSDSEVSSEDNTENVSSEAEAPTEVPTEGPSTITQNKIYYFDTLITCGDSYKNGDFIAMDIDDNDSTTTTTYGSILLNKVKKSISINAFISGVNNLPNYLTGYKFDSNGNSVNDLSKAYTIGNISYHIPKNYLLPFGQLFMEKLTEVMSNSGQTIIDKYKGKTISGYETFYNDANITSEVLSNIIVISDIKIKSTK